MIRDEECLDDDSQDEGGALVEIEDEFFGGSFEERKNVIDQILQRFAVFANEILEVSEDHLETNEATHDFLEIAAVLRACDEAVHEIRPSFREFLGVEDLRQDIFVLGATDVGHGHVSKRTNCVLESFVTGTTDDRLQNVVLQHLLVFV